MIDLMINEPDFRSHPGGVRHTVHWPRGGRWGSTAIYSAARLSLMLTSL